jgi:hypothetical protein
MIEKLSESDRTIVSDIVNTHVRLRYAVIRWRHVHDLMHLVPRNPIYSKAQLKALALDPGGYRCEISRALDILIRIRHDEIINSSNEPWESADDTDLDFPHEYGLPHEFS